MTPDDEIELETYRRIFKYLTTDITCSECGNKIVDHVPVSRCGCGEHPAGPPFAKLLEHMRGLVVAERRVSPTAQITSEDVLVSIDEDLAYENDTDW